MFSTIIELASPQGVAISSSTPRPRSKRTDTRRRSLRRLAAPRDGRTPTIARERSERCNPHPHTAHPDPNARTPIRICEPAGRRNLLQHTVHPDPSAQTPEGDHHVALRLLVMGELQPLRESAANVAIPIHTPCTPTRTHGHKTEFASPQGVAISSSTPSSRYKPTEPPERAPRVPNRSPQQNPDRPSNYRSPQDRDG